MSRLQMSAALMAMSVAAIGAWEGMRQSAYWDPYGRVWTVCYGETRGVKKGDWYTKEQCDEMFGGALVDFERRALRCVIDNGSRIPDKSYMAIVVDLPYNIGVGGFCKSSVRTWANNYMQSGKMSDLAEACRRLKRYVKSGGKTLSGLVNRRGDMHQRCMAGVKEKTVTGIVEGDDK